MSSNRRTPPPLPPKPGSASRQYSSQSAQPPPPLRVNTGNVGGSFRRPEIRSGTSSFSATFTASASSWASKAKSGLNNYAKPMAKAAISHASNYVEAATDYINESRNGDSSSRSMSEDLGSDGSRQRARTSPRPVDKLSLLPQWAVRRPRKNREGLLLKDKDGRLQFDLEVRVSGYCATMTSAENAGYVMRAALKIMRGVAALPPVIAETALRVEDKMTSSPVSSPTMEKIADELDKDMHRQGSRTTRSSTISSMNTVSSKQFPKNNSAENLLSQISKEQLQALHDNMEERLAGFRSSVSVRRVQVSIYLVAPSENGTDHDPKQFTPTAEDEPLMTSVFTTSSQGLFAQRMMIPWERLRSIRQADKLATDDPSPANGYALYVLAELLSDGTPNQLPATASSVAPATSPQFSQPTLVAEPSPVPAVASKTDNGANAFFSSAAKPLNRGSGGEPGALQALGKTDVTASVLTKISSPGGVRIISDLDDTVKYSNILGGAREAFRNAFCRSVEELGIDGMAEMYQELARAGVAGYHFVSNSPNELQQVIESFFRHHGFPDGYSLMLKYYGKGHLVNSFMEEPAERKLRGVEAVMDSFQTSKFILIGDSGEQDLELYVAIAKARPEQVLAVVIRDVTTSLVKRRGNTSRKATMSEVDFAALDEALGPVDGHDQAAKAGIGGRKRDAAKKLIRVASGVDLSRLRLSSPSETTLASSIQHSPRRQKSVDSISSMSSLDQPSSVPSPDTPLPDKGPQVKASQQAGPKIGPADIATIGATGPSSDPLISLEDEVREVEEEFQELSATQTKLLRRAAEWNERVNRLSKEIPGGIHLLLFKEPSEIEETLLQIVKDNR